MTDTRDHFAVASTLTGARSSRLQAADYHAATEDSTS